MLAKVANKDTRTVVSALIKQAKRLPDELYKSLTWDRGKELADHRRFTLATDIDVYFCDPQSPWQRGSNENTNGLLRQYFPKGTDLSVYSSSTEQDRPSAQRTATGDLEIRNPSKRFNACVASTGSAGNPKADIDCKFPLSRASIANARRRAACCLADRAASESSIPFKPLPQSQEHRYPGTGVGASGWPCPGSIRRERSSDSNPLLSTSSNSSDQPQQG